MQHGTETAIMMRRPARAADRGGRARARLGGRAGLAALGAGWVLAFAALAAAGADAAAADMAMLSAVALMGLGLGCAAAADGEGARDALE